MNMEADNEKTIYSRFVPKLTEIPVEVDEDEETVREHWSYSSLNFQNFPHCFEIPLVSVKNHHHLMCQIFQIFRNYHHLIFQVKIVQLVKSQDTLTGERNAEPIVGATIKVIDISLYIIFVFVLVHCICICICHRCICIQLGGGQHRANPDSASDARGRCR